VLVGGCRTLHWLHAKVYGLTDGNPARGRRMRVRVPKPERTFLEMDELAGLLDVAGAQEEVARLGMVRG